MKFFIPYGESQEQEKNVFDSIKTHLQDSLGANFDNRKIFSIYYVHEGKKYFAEVGKQHSLNGESVIAILHEPGRNLYHVCTPTRGGARGGSILVGGYSIKSAIDFEN